MKNYSGWRFWVVIALAVVVLAGGVTILVKSDFMRSNAGYIWND